MCIPFTLRPSERLRREMVLLCPSPSMCYSAKRSSARVNGPPFHAAKERDSGVKYSYWNSAGLRWHLDSLTQTLQVITRANDLEEFTHVFKSLTVPPHMSLDPGATLFFARAKAAPVAFLSILKQRWDATVPGCLPGPWGPSPVVELWTLTMSKKGGKKSKSIYVCVALLFIKAFNEKY